MEPHPRGGMHLRRRIRVTTAAVNQAVMEPSIPDAVLSGWAWEMNLACQARGIQKEAYLPLEVKLEEVEEEEGKD